LSISGRWLKIIKKVFESIKLSRQVFLSRGKIPNFHVCNKLDRHRLSFCWIKHIRFPARNFEYKYLSSKTKIKKSDTQNSLQGITQSNALIIFFSRIKTQGGDVSDRQTSRMGPESYIKTLNSAGSLRFCNLLAINQVAVAERS